MQKRDTARYEEIQRGEMQRGQVRRGEAQRGAVRATARSAPLVTEFLLTVEYIALDNLLKLTGNAPSGGAAKMLVAEGAVKVDGKIELRKTGKIRAGQLVAVGTARIRVIAA